MLVLRNSCGQSFSYILNGPNFEILGEGDLHDPKYNGDRVTAHLAQNYPDQDLLMRTPNHCVISVDFYPTDAFHETYHTNTPMVIAMVTACVFALKAALFGLYDLIIQTRNRKVTTVAVRSNAIVSSLFPEAIKERLLAEQEEDEVAPSSEQKLEERDESGMFKNKPIADLYPEATVLCKLTLQYIYIPEDKSSFAHQFLVL
jgi:hypothetical protein